MNKKIIFVFLILIIFVVGCGKGEEETSGGNTYLGGTTGLLLSFLEDAPPKEVYDGGVYPFEVVVKLKNDGEWDILAEDALITISGVAASDFSLTHEDLQKNPDEDLGRSYLDSEGNIVDGTTTFVNFPGFNYNGVTSGNLPPFTLRADACYKYGTRSMSQLCFKEDLYDTSEESLCIVNEEKEIFSSRAPLQIISLKESARGKEKIGFTFKIAHMGNGGIFEKESQCNTKGIIYENKIWVDVNLVGGNTAAEGLVCTGLQDGAGNKGYVTMYSGERAVTCTMPTSESGDYTKPVEITLEYDYKEDISTQLLLKHTVA
ncbi:MAG: hypothetical protein MAG795_01064 [Candidatus Woesearchaeota archaeon]|nr:hypothetical protein [Candidatus Woesearchaeota archaeon]